VWVLLNHFFGYEKNVIFWDKFAFEAVFLGFMGVFGVRTGQKRQKIIAVVWNDD
jgi:hypothetical protein